MCHKDQLENYLHKNIPITKALGINIELISPQEVILKAPFSKNINHKKTVFGGSLHAVATLACWCFIYVNVENLQPLDIVITGSTIKYLTPVTKDFTAKCVLSDEDLWKRFMAMLSLKGKGRVTLNATIFQDEKLAVDYTGTFAAIKIT